MSRRNKRHNSASKYLAPQEEPASCVHIERSITPTKVKSNLPHGVFGRCSECAVKEKIYLCLKCGNQFCTTHSDKHSSLNNHSLNYSLTNGVVHCAKCARELPPECHSAIERVVHIIEEMLKKYKVETVPQKKDEKVDVSQSNGVGGDIPASNTAQESVKLETYIIGLKNTGVICFFNSVLQNLIQTPMLRACVEYTNSGYSDVLHSKAYGLMNISVSGDRGLGMSSKLHSFFQQLDSRDRSKALHAFKIFQEMSSYNTGLSDGQQDAQEAYHAIVHSLSSDEAKRRKQAVFEKLDVVRATFKDLPRTQKQKISGYANLARSETFIDHLFGGTTINQITCLTCSSITKTLDCFVDLSVPLPKKKDRVRAKQKSSAEAGLSKHQKKKQQKDNRKGKKGKERRNSSSVSQLNDSSNVRSNGDLVSPPTLPPSPTLAPSVYLQNGTKEEYVSDEACGLRSPSVCNAVEMDEIQVDVENINSSGALDLNSVILSIETDENAEHVYNWLEHSQNSVEDTQSDICNHDDLIVNGTSIQCKEEDCSGDEICDKMDNLVIDSPGNTKLNGGTCYGLTADTESKDDDMFSGLFEQPADDNESNSSDLNRTAEDLDTSECLGEDTLEACIAEFCREEILDGDNQFSCANCARPTGAKNTMNVSYAKSSESSLSDEDASEDSDTDEKIKPVLRDAKCRYFLNTLPSILVMHLKRFTANNRGLLQKERRHIEFPLDLELDKFVLNGSGNKYKLFGVVDHSGSLHRGHYIAYVRKRDTALDVKFKNQTIPLSAHIKLLGQMNSERTKDNLDKWYCCNDERVSEVPLKKVLNADAYLLFYERVLPYS